MNNPNLGANLKSHSFQECHSINLLNSIFVDTNEFRCTKCGFTASGNEHGPTVYITALSLGKEILSCDEMMIKDIIT